jgi:hypothetical protein
MQLLKLHKRIINMEFITHVLFTVEGKQKMIPFIVRVDETKPTYEQCQEAIAIADALIKKHVPKGDKVKDVHHRTYEVGQQALILN